MRAKKWAAVRGKKGLIVGQVRMISKKEWEGRREDGTLFRKDSRREVVDALLGES